MQCPNRACGVTVADDASCCPKCGTRLKAEVEAAVFSSDTRSTGNKQVRVLSMWSLGLGIIAFILPWAGMAALHAMGYQAHWRMPFIGGLFPASYLPMEGLQAASLCIGLCAAVMGHLAIVRYRRLSGAGNAGRYEIVKGLLSYAAIDVLLVLSLAYGGFKLGFFFSFLLVSLCVSPVIFLLTHFSVTSLCRLRQRAGTPLLPVLGALIGYVSVVVMVLSALSFFGKQRYTADMSACGSNLQTISMALQAYRDDHDGVYPPLSSQPGVLMFDKSAIDHPETLASNLTCPLIRYADTGQPASPFDDQSYFYLGYALNSEDDVEAFARAYRNQIAAGGDFEHDLVLEEAGGARVFHRLSEQYLFQSIEQGGRSGGCQFPLVIERSQDHVNADAAYEISEKLPGAHVLFRYGYANGDLQFVPYGTWPVTEKTLNTLAELAELRPVANQVAKSDQ